MQLLLAASPRVVHADASETALNVRDAALLAWLAIEGPTPRTRLAVLLWPRSPPDVSGNALRQRLFQLKRQLGVELVTGHATLALADGVMHDLGDAQQVMGTLGEGLGPELLAWLGRERERRGLRRQAELESLADAAEGAADYGTALMHARALLDLDRLSEAAHRRVIRLFYLHGDRGSALLAFDRCEQMLKDEVGARPSAETLALLQTISAAAPPAPGRGHRLPASVLLPPRLVGRDAAWQALHDARDGGYPAVVTGDGGMGKSRLVGDFAHARGRTIVVSARPGDARVVYASASRLLRALPADVLHRLDPPLRRTLAWLLPELGEATPPPETRAGRAGFFNAVTAALDAGSFALDGFVFDDLHFADAASIELLQYVIGASTRHWVVTARDAEVSPAGRALIDEALAGRSAAHVVLAPLTLADIAEIVDSLGIEGLVGSTVAATLMRHCGGNPLYVLETLKAWLARGDAGDRSLPARLPVAGSLHTVIERRIGHLSADAVRLARCAAVAAPDFSIELASHVLGMRTLDLADPCAELEAAQVLRDGAFAHDLIYEAALASVPATVARRLHAEIAAFLQQHDGEPARLAQHWLQAGDCGRAGAAFTAAAERSRKASSPIGQCEMLAEAARCFERANRPDERFQALLQRARTLASNDLGVDAQAAVEAVEQAAATDEQRLLALDARLELAMTRYEVHESLRLGEQAIAQARALGRTDLELRFAITFSGALCDARRADEAVLLLEPHADWVRAHSDVEQQWEYWEATALALDYANRLADAMPAWEAARAVAQGAERRDMLWKTMSNTASTQAKMGLVAQAAELAEQAHQIACMSNDSVTLRVMQMQVTLAHRLRDVGRYDRALALLEEALAHYAGGGASQSDIALAEQRLVVLYQQLGQPARALHLLAPERPGVPLGVAMIRLAHRAELEAQMGRAGLPLMREAMEIIPNADDIFHRIVSLFATRLVPPDEGEAMAANLALWATTRERHGVALAGHVRAAACALALGAPARALPHVEAARRLATRYLPDSFYLPELWLVSAKVHATLGREPAAHRAAADGQAWVRQVHDSHVPPGFRDSFLNRNAINRELMALPR
jgi:DNA-binding SARP family transcriptional activator/tetratricopeptide (TPR) repeat protein